MENTESPKSAEKKGDVMTRALVAALVLVAVGAGAWMLGAGSGAKSGVTPIGAEDARTRIETFLKTNTALTDATVSEATEESGVYKSIVTVGAQSIPVYLSLDGTKIFPEALDTTPVETADATTQPSQDIPKSARPEVRLFVMSYCPYGTQMQKGILPVLETLGDEIDFRLQFVSYAMHDKKELDENLRQYCVQRDEPRKLATYLSCFLEAGQGTEAACLSKAGVNASKNAACVAETDKEFDVSKNYADKSTWSGGRYPLFDVDAADNETYGVQGSPTLVVNGVETQTGRDAASILSTVCSAFEEAPEACGAELSSASPSPGFGFGTSETAAAASCGS